MNKNKFYNEVKENTLMDDYRVLHFNVKKIPENNYYANLQTFLKQTNITKRQGIIIIKILRCSCYLTTIKKIELLTH